MNIHMTEMIPLTKNCSQESTVPSESAENFGAHGPLYMLFHKLHAFIACLNVDAGTLIIQSHLMYILRLILIVILISGFLHARVFRCDFVRHIPAVFLQFA